MRFSQVVIADLKTIEDCDNAVEAIENDYLNCQGGITAWTSGYTTYMLAGATKKIEAIQRKNDKLWDKQVKADYKVFLKTNPDISFENYTDYHVC